jgi:ABC-2 type transport system ATP-binding protein/lipopolysaccharide transport system ATP-binding protein
MMLSVSNLSVSLRHEHNRIRSVREYVVARLSRAGIGMEWVTVLDRLSFEVAAGALFAVVGPNGAGKTTLLRVLAGIVPPSQGSVVVGGRLAPLIELGAGFDPELTGRENVFLYGAILGIQLSTVGALYDEIVAFAGLADSMEKAVKNYSSGMAARLGFAVATCVVPDVLLVDEVLAVGDEEFRRRCFSRIAQLRADGTAVVLVTHDLDLVVREAGRGIYLSHGGGQAAYGDAAAVVEAYRRDFQSSEGRG